MSRAKLQTRGGGAVMEHKATTADIEAEADPIRRLHLKLNYMPTPPWATRALFTHVIPLAVGRVWEPAAGEGHMAAVLAEHFDEVWRTDVYDHGGLNVVGSFVGAGLDVAPVPSPAPDWIITNPPFSLGLEFVERALASPSVASLC